jgi:hypothetical protein
LVHPDPASIDIANSMLAATVNDLIFPMELPRMSKPLAVVRATLARKPLPRPAADTQCETRGG